MPIFSPFDTIFWCSPWVLLSLIASAHHIAEVMATTATVIFVFISTIFPLIMVAVDDTIAHIHIDAVIGHGLILTIWNWWYFFII